MIKYRPEIDGLRAIAVIAVIIYHSRIHLFGQRLDGGFIGVDIFFVISGYLITSIILKELLTTGSFSFVRFYERRIRRIIPALLVMMLISSPFAYIYLLPTGFVDFLKSALTTLLFGSNYYFYFSDHLYAAQSGLYKPLLHTWSLAIEEQFYILFPILLFVIVKYKSKFIIHFLLLIFFISLIIANQTSQNNPSLSFYSLYTRMWEIIAGSILAYFELKKKRNKFTKLNLILPGFGLFLILHSFFFFNNQLNHPSFLTLYPVIGTCLIIWFSHSDELITKILSTKLLVSIGLISYSLYLYHQPIFAFIKINGTISGSLIGKLLLVTTLFLISVLSYYFIERPFRLKKIKFNRIVYFISTNYLIFAILIIGVLKNKNIIFDKNFYEFDELLNTRTNWEKCEVEKILNNNYCQIGNFKKKIYLIGDSHLIPLVKDLGQKVNQFNYGLVNLIQPGKIYRGKLKEDKRVDFLKNIKNSVFIIGGYYQRETENELKSLLSFYKKDFDIFLKNNNKILFLDPIPEINFEPNRDLYLLKSGKISSISINKSDVINKNMIANNFINSFNNISVINIQEIFCDNLKCYAAYKNNIILKSDYDHPSLYAAKRINDKIINYLFQKE